MDLDGKSLILFLLGVIQALFFWIRQRDADEVKEIKNSIKETAESIKKMESMLSNLEKQIAVANYALFKERRGENHE